jgi:hypothetical protein
VTEDEEPVLDDINVKPPQVDDGGIWVWTGAKWERRWLKGGAGG